MAVQNRIATQPQQEGVGAMLVKYEVNGSEVKLSPALVRDYLVSGDKDCVTGQEIAMFINLCKFNGLNPWVKEAYCIKYGTNPATMVVGKEAFQKRAEAHPAYDGCASGIITLDPEVGTVEYKIGCFRLDTEIIVGGWAEVWRKDRSHSTRTEVSFSEYAGRKKSGELNSQWAAKPGTMIRKVALVQALREAFPNNIGGMYAPEERGVAEPEDTVVIDAETMPVGEGSPENSESTAGADVAAALFGD